jgi:hypothetical protein
MARLVSRVPQRTRDDCVICTVAMALGYSYKRVQSDSRAYPQLTEDGKFFEWWVGYMQDEGRHIALRPSIEAYDLWKHQDGTVGILGMTIERERRRHVAALDTVGVVDPANGAPDHVELAEYIIGRCAQGFLFDPDFLLVTPGTRMGAPLIARLRRRFRRRPTARYVR